MRGESMSPVNKILEVWPDLNNIEQLPGGGQKEVYRAQSQQFGDVAIKVIKIGRNNDLRAQREIEIMRACEIPHIPKLYDCQNCQFDNSNQMVLIEEYISGITLREHFVQNQQMSIDEAIVLMDFLLSAIVELEQRQIVHRDIKPENIIISSLNHQYKLLDFGIARDLNQVSLTATEGFGPNTPGYAPPEQFNNMKSDISSVTDLFAIGVVAYEAITGSNPYIQNGDNGFLNIYIRTNTMPTPDLPIHQTYNTELFSFIRSLMAKHIHRRPPSAREAYKWFLEILEERKKMIEDINNPTFQGV